MDNDELLGIDWSKAKETQEITLSVNPLSNTATGQDVTYNMRLNGDDINFIPDYVILRYAALCQNNLTNTVGAVQRPIYLWCSLIDNIICPIYQTNSNFGETGSLATRIRTGTSQFPTYGKLNRVIKVDKIVESIVFRVMTQNATANFNTFTPIYLTQNLELQMEFYKF